MFLLLESRAESDKKTRVNKSWISNHHCTAVLCIKNVDNDSDYKYSTVGTNNNKNLLFKFSKNSIYACYKYYLLHNLNVTLFCTA